ncbi:uncharacterized protein PpBr36_11155 [Pyricularia pennisetigena]|uniref:uncharacterized protein n=1 Tax=Pyricularia pennisetigena TaxID=1578925 RepID=UPI00114DB229|nr:uncharacterized protein PpBr36_11155 [Pyricularia pennisetigena]TLS20502.1 hypothetical protein PpBr36_11155 [Pyricularia pennisetigena]
MAFPQLQWQPCYNGPEGCSSSKLNHTERSPCAGSESLDQNHLVSDFRFVLGSNEPEQDVHEGTISSESAESRRKLVSEPSIQTLECHTDTAGQSWGQSDRFGTAFYGIPPQDCTLKIYGLECPMAQDDMCGFLCALQCKWKGWMTHGL